ncbi:hypothetical protein KBI23_25450 [bacterium]|nr:hypothetical protein [bacterium]
MLIALFVICLSVVAVSASNPQDDSRDVSVQRTPNGKLFVFVGPSNRKTFLLNLSEAQVRHALGSPWRVKDHDDNVKGANVEQVFEYPCDCDGQISTLYLGFEKKVVCRAVIVHWDRRMGGPVWGHYKESVK